MTEVSIPSPPAHPPVSVLLAESTLRCPFILYGLPLTTEDRRHLAALAEKLSKQEVRWLMNTFMAFSLHGQRSVSQPG